MVKKRFRNRTFFPFRKKGKIEAHTSELQNPTSTSSSQPSPSVAAKFEGPGHGLSSETKDVSASKIEVREVNGIIYEVLSSSVRVMGLKAEQSEIEIASTVAGKPVKVIAKRAFANNTTLEKITFPDTITTLGTEAFQNCVALREIELPPLVEVLNQRLFEGCTNLTSVHLPFKLKRIAKRVFADCANLSSLPHYVATGPADEIKILRTLVETALPVRLEWIGIEAFQGCVKLQQIVIPYKVTRINDRSFEGCSSLAQVWLHSNLQSIYEGAFSGCEALVKLRLPESVNFIGDRVFPEQLTIIAENGSYGLEYAETTDLRYFSSENEKSTQMVSTFGDPQSYTITSTLQSPSSLSDFLSENEISPPGILIERERPVEGTTSLTIRPSRFRLEEGIYKPEDVPNTESHTVTLMMTGDLMCGARQQRNAEKNNMADFDNSFSYVKPILSKADLSIGNLEFMSSPSSPYMSEQLYVGDRPHLNGPSSFLSSIRNAGFDAVVNAQNHMFDTGAQGILETLEAINSNQLIHVGMFASQDDPRVMLFDMNGIRVALIAYLDPVRQLMKQANFSQRGIASLASHFSKNQVELDVKQAADAGADFILSYAHWGKEYTHEISKTQRSFAQLLADSGVDYIFGSHSHCLQTYEVITSSTGREVPVVFSGGNFLSDIQRKQPLTKDTIISFIEISKEADGSISIVTEGYIPCKIISRNTLPGFSVTVPCQKLEQGALGYKPAEAKKDIARIKDIMGEDYQCFLNLPEKN